MSNGRQAALPVLIAVVLTVSGAAGPAAATSMSTAHAAPLRPSPQAHHYRDLPPDAVHPGSVLVAFRSPVQIRGHRIAADIVQARSRGLDPQAVTTAADQVNRTLDGLKAGSVRRLFTNIPQAQLADARNRAIRSTGRDITDLTQLYEVDFDPAVNDGEAANRLQASGLVTAAMPDYRYRAGRPTPPTGRAAPSTPVRLPAQRTAGRPQPRNDGEAPPAATLPANYGLRTDAQSMHDAAANNLAGTIAELAARYHQQPGEGETITNISLGTVDDSSTVTEDGQRYLEQTGLPRIPAYISSQDCDEQASCSVNLSGTGTNTADGQGDLQEVLLDFSVMAPPPAGDPRVPHQQAPGQLGQLLGTAYGADYRLINPRHNNSADFFAAWLGAGFLQDPRPTVINASLGDGLADSGFPDDFFEAETIIRDLVAVLVYGRDITVTISSGDGQVAETAAAPPDGLSGPYDIAGAGAQVPDLNGAVNDPGYTYQWTSEPRLIPDSGSTSAGGTTLNDIFAAPPSNTTVPAARRHDQVTTETRFTGQQNFHTGSGTRVNVAAPADGVLALAQVEDANGMPVSPTAVQPQLIGGTSASAPQIAAASAIVRQVARLAGTPLGAAATRQLLADTGRTITPPAFDRTQAPIGRALDITAAVDAVLARAGKATDPSLVRMTVAQRKAVPGNNGYGRGFFTDTGQDPELGVASIDLGEGLVAPSGPDNETVGTTGDNVNAPITFGLDGYGIPTGAPYSWTLRLGSTRVTVPAGSYDATRPYLRLLPSEIFGMLHQPVTARVARNLVVSASVAGRSLSQTVTFAAAGDGTYTHAPAPVVPQVATDAAGGRIRVGYDARGLTAPGGIQLLVSDIDRPLPRAFPDRDQSAHGFAVAVTGTVGVADVPLASLQGAGTYGFALRALDKAGTPMPDSTGPWIPVRVIPAGTEAVARSPKVQAEQSAFASEAPLWWDVADVSADGGSDRFTVSYDVRNVPGAKGTLVEISAGATDFLRGVFFTGNIVNANLFTNPQGDRPDAGNRLGQPGASARVPLAGSVAGTHTVSAAQLGLAGPPPDACDRTYDLRVFATDGAGHILGAASRTSLISLVDLTAPGCRS